MRPVLLPAAVAAVLGSTPAVAAPPTAPPDLRVDVYSDTAAELFWSRSTDPDGAVRGYEIRRDGELLATRDGSSFFTDELTPGRAFDFAVTAIDGDGERSEPARVRVVGGDRDGAASLEGDRPAPFANLRSKVYSSTAGEVFWDRVPGAGLSYEVSIDGEVAATTDGTSYFVEIRPELDGARVEVVAVAPDGTRSSASGTIFGDDFTDETAAPVSRPTRPTNARIETYSGTTAELFWDRPSIDARVDVARISRDGVEIGTSAGTSFLDDARVPGRAYRYEIAFVDRLGNVSDAAIVGRGDGWGGELSVSDGGSPLALANADALLAGVVGVIDGNPPLELDRSLSLPSFTSPRGFGGRRAGEAFPIPGSDGERTLVRCERGGYAHDDLGGQFGGFRLDFDGCASGERTLAGVFRIVFVDQQFYRVVFEDLQVAGGADGDVAISRGALSSFTSADLSSVQDTLLEVAYTQGDVRVEALTQFENDAVGPSPRTFLVLNFDVAAPWTGGQTLSVGTPTLLRGGGEGSPNYSTGTLSVTDANGSSLLVDADTGDVSTYALTSTILGTATSEIRSWTPETSPRCLTVPERSGDALPGCEAD